MKWLYLVITIFLISCVENYTEKPVAPKLIKEEKPIVYYSPNDSNIIHFGRIYFDKKKTPSYSYPGINFRTHFTGDTIVLYFKHKPKTKADTSFNYYQIIIDQKEPILLTINNHDTIYPLPISINYGKHQIEFFKRTESRVGKDYFLGLATNGELTKPKEKELKFEFIGNSITCGFGNEISTNDPKGSSFHAKNQNNYMSFGAITARAFDSEYLAVAYSGKGIYRDNTGDTSLTLAKIYNRILPDTDDSHLWEPKRYSPDIIVINLGTNDFMKNTPPLDKFTNSYMNFIDRLRKYHPNAYIICTSGPMNQNGYPKGTRHKSTIRRSISQMVSQKNRDGDKKILKFFYSAQKPPYGEAWHPSIQGHEQMAKELTEFISTNTPFQPKAQKK